MHIHTDLNSQIYHVPSVYILLREGVGLFIYAKDTTCFYSNNDLNIHFDKPSQPYLTKQEKGKIKIKRLVIKETL